MLRCPNCHHEQEVGKFCGKCGSPVEEVVAENNNTDEGANHVPETQVLVTAPLEEQEDVVEAQAVAEEPSQPQPQPQEQPPQAQQAQPQPPQPPQAQVQQEQQQARQNPDPVEPPPSFKVDEVKENAVKYWATFLTVLKSPSKAFALDERHFTFGIINFIVYLFTFTFSLYMIVNVFYKDFAYESIPFFEFAIPVFILFTIFAVVATAVLILFEKIAVKQMSFKVFFAQFSGAITPFIIANAVAFITALAASGVLTLALLQFSFVFSFVVTPSLFLLEKLNHYKIQEYRLYLSYGVSVAILFAFYVVGGFILNALIEDIVSQTYGFGEFFRLFDLLF